MKKRAVIAVVVLLLAVFFSGTAYGCFNCHIVWVPDPDGGAPKKYYVCLEDPWSDGWFICVDGGALGTLFGCWYQWVCFSTGWPPEY